MASYASDADVIARFESERAVAHLTDDAETGVADPAVIAEARAYADGMINSYLARRYGFTSGGLVNTSDANILALLKSTCVDLAIYYLFARPGMEITARMQTFYDRIRQWLQDVVAGKADLPGASPPPSPTSRSPLFEFGTADEGTDSRRLFTRTTMQAL